jgi:superfamily II DNA/RNA helicase
MMKVGFLKRLESSIYSFRETMQRTLEKIEQIIEKINDYKEYQQVTAQIDNDDLEINELELEDEEVRDAFQVGKKLVFDLEDLYVDAWLKDLKEDHANIEAIHTLTKDITPDRDAKLAKLKELIEEKVNNPAEFIWVHPDTNEKITKKNKKVLVFTAFADTARYLYENLVDWAQKELKVHVAMVTGGTYNNETTLGDQKFEYILANFSPISKKRYRLKEKGLGQVDEIDLLIATDCISEGQNLQDCDYMINYDIHWNPVRIIQRFGRIDRIGSWNDAIQLVNFWPTKDLEKYIALKYRVEARMALVDLTATGDDNLLDMDAIEDELSFRDKQLLRLKDEILDLEDFNETVTLSEFTLDDFRIELTRYLEGNRKELDDAPLGLYTVVPKDPQHKGIRPGVIFCLRQKGEVDSTKVNPLQPYFLIYVLEDDTVRYTFAHPKQILEIMRTLCAGKKSTYEDLCELFDNETSNGEDMETYNVYLETAVKSIRSTFIKRAASSLAGGRDAVLLPEDQQVRANTDFDLITWLVIMNE